MAADGGVHLCYLTVSSSLVEVAVAFEILSLKVRDQVLILRSSREPLNGDTIDCDPLFYSLRTGLS